MGQLLKDCSASVVQKSTPEKLQDPGWVAEYLEDKFCDSSGEARSFATCWAMAATYQALLVTIQHSGGGEESRATGIKATQTAAEPEEQPMPAAVAPIQKYDSRTNPLA